MKTTKGPWKVDTDYKGQTVIASQKTGDMICIIRNYANDGMPTPEEATNNTQLISAAPELLEALIECKKAFKENLSKWQYKDEIIMLNAMNKAELAINKANGHE